MGCDKTPVGSGGFVPRSAAAAFAGRHTLALVSACQRHSLTCAGSIGHTPADCGAANTGGCESFAHGHSAAEPSPSTTKGAAAIQRNRILELQQLRGHYVQHETTLSRIPEQQGHP